MFGENQQYPPPLAIRVRSVRAVLHVVTGAQVGLLLIALLSVTGLVDGDPLSVGPFLKFVLLFLSAVSIAGSILGYGLSARMVAENRIPAAVAGLALSLPSSGPLLLSGLSLLSPLFGGELSSQEQRGLIFVMVSSIVVIVTSYCLARLSYIARHFCAPSARIAPPPRRF